MFEDQRKNTEGQDEQGKFALGNQLWRNRKNNVGQRRRFETPDDMLAACVEYFEWADANPLWEYKAFANGTTAKLPHARAMTIKGMCAYINLSVRQWSEYRKLEDFAEVVEDVEAFIYDQKFAGAAAGLFSATIIARDLGLSDKQDIDQTVTVEVVDTFDGDDTDSE